MKLQILIPTLHERKESFDRLVAHLNTQIHYHFDLPFKDGDQSTLPIQIIWNDAPKGVAIGIKRNELLQRATADYVAFIDDDDTISPSYISSIMEGINKGVDCCSLRGIITWNGETPETFEHSIRYGGWFTNHTGAKIKYERYPNHLNCIKREIAQKFVFPEISHGEDHDWSTQVHNSGLIKTEHYIDEVIYNYDYIPNK